MPYFGQEISNSGAQANGGLTATDQDYLRRRLDKETICWRRTAGKAIRARPGEHQTRRA